MASLCSLERAAAPAPRLAGSRACRRSLLAVQAQATTSTERSAGPESSAVRMAEARQRLAEVRQRVAATQQRLGRAAASAAAARSGAMALGQMAAALDAAPATAGGVTAAAVARQAARADEAAAALVDAVAGEASRQQALLKSLHSQLAGLEKSIDLPDDTPASAPAAATIASAATATSTAASPAATPSVPAAAEGEDAAAGSATHQAAPNGYDMVMDLLASLAADPGVQGDSRYDPLRSLLAAAPAPEEAEERYDFARSLLRGLAAADEGSMDSPFDMAHGLLQRVREGDIVPAGGSRYDPAWALLKEATLLEEWAPGGPKRFDPRRDFFGWAASPADTSANPYDPWAQLVLAAARADAEASWAPADSKYDPLPAFFAALAAAAASSPKREPAKYDPAPGLLTAWGDPDWLGPSGQARYDPVAAALDGLAGWEGPSGANKYCPVPDLMGLELPAGPQPLHAQLDGWMDRWKDKLLDGWAANSGSWEPPKGVIQKETNDGGVMYGFAS